MDEIAAAHGIALLVQFGSTVTGATHLRSDLDLAVLFGDARDSFDKAADLSVALQAVLPGRVQAIPGSPPLLRDGTRLRRARHCLGAPVTIDPALVTRKLLLIASDLDALGPVSTRGLDAYRARPTRPRAAGPELSSRRRRA
ncbi:MAG TPA: hypothetical protein VMM93_11730 [Vicinamibacterales bacterium]|nr:hypothetical protein [Vicinamibacterales bacterium]